MRLTEKLPDYYRDSPPVSELERVLGAAAGQVLDDHDDVLQQLWVSTATWGLDRWESWCGLPTDRTKTYDYRRKRILARLRGQGTTTAEVIAAVAASFGYDPGQISVVEKPEQYGFEVIVSGISAPPGDVSDMTLAIDEIKPAHLEWHFVWQRSPFAEAVRVFGGSWRVREVTLPPMKEG